jgi:hypothetical protein
MLDAEKQRIWLRPIGVFGRLVTYAVLFLLLYVYWPSDITQKPFASLTLSDIGGQVAAVSIGFLLIRALLDPSGADVIKDAWGWVGVLIVALAVLAVFYDAWGWEGALIVAMAGLAVFICLDWWEIRMAPKRTTPPDWDWRYAKREAAENRWESADLREREAEVRARGRREGWLPDD